MTETRIPAGVRERLSIGPGLTLVQTPASPYCISVRTALEASGSPFTLYDVSLADRRAVVELTGGAYYAVPVLVDAGRSPAVVVYESRDDGTEVARYASATLGLDLFPAGLEGLQDLVVRYIEGEVEDTAFRIDDVFLFPSIGDVVERTLLLRHKERKFGRGCVEGWRAHLPQLTATLVELLAPLERMLARHPFLLGEQPTFADYALYGVLGRLTYSGGAALPAQTPHIRRWHADLPAVRLRSIG